MRTAVVASLLALASCSLYNGDDQPIGDDTPACEEPRPGCPDDACSPACGDVIYQCTEDGWSAATVCDTCLGRSLPYPSTWTLTATPDSTTECASLGTRQLVLDAQYPVDPAAGYVALAPNDASVEIVSTAGQFDPVSPTCVTNLVVTLRDNGWQGAVDPADVRYELVLAGLTNSITGTFDATIGSCGKSGTVSGTFTLDGAP